MIILGEKSYKKLQLELSELDLQVFQISEKVNLFFGNLRKGY
jgi:hypothetical protein